MLQCTVGRWHRAATHDFGALLDLKGNLGKLHKGKGLFRSGNLENNVRATARTLALPAARRDFNAQLLPFIGVSELHRVSSAAGAGTTATDRAPSG